MKTQKFQTPLAKAKGRGSSHHGAGHWIAQRVTAVALVPLFVWFIFSLLNLLGSDYYDAVRFFKSPVNSITLSLLIIASFYHSSLGLQVVIEDYVHTEWKKIGLLLVIKLGSFILAFASVIAIIKLHLGV